MPIFPSGCPLTRQLTPLFSLGNLKMFLKVSRRQEWSSQGHLRPGRDIFGLVDMAGICLLMSRSQSDSVTV